MNYPAFFIEHLYNESPDGSLFERGYYVLYYKSDRDGTPIYMGEGVMADINQLIEKLQEQMPTATVYKKDGDGNVGEHLEIFRTNQGGG